MNTRFFLQGDEVGDALAVKSGAPVYLAGAEVEMDDGTRAIGLLSLVDGFEGKEEMLFLTGIDSSGPRATLSLLDALRFITKKHGDSIFIAPMEIGHRDKFMQRLIKTTYVMPVAKTDKIMYYGVSAV